MTCRSDSAGMTCPHCDAPVSLRAVTRESEMTMRLVPTPGTLMRGDVVAGQIHAMADLMECVARDQGAPFRAFVTGIEYDAGSVLSVTMALMRTED